MDRDDELTVTNSVFEEPWWLDIVAPGQWHEVVLRDEKDDIVARWPYVAKRGFLGTKVFMPVFTQTLGPWIKDREPNQGNKHLSYQKEIYSKLLSKMPKSYSFEMVLDSSNHYILPFRWCGFTFTPTFSYRLDNISNTDETYKQFNKTVKKNIKAALNKVVVKDTTDINVFYSLYESTFRTQGRKPPISFDLVNRVISAAFEHNAGRLLIAYDKENNEPHSGAFFLYDSKVCYYLIGGTAGNHKNSGAQNLVLWEGIKRAAYTSEIFDFEGSMVEGIENFFRQFGGYQVVNYEISKSLLIYDIAGLLKPRVKKLLGYKI